MRKHIAIKSEMQFRAEDLKSLQEQRNFLLLWRKLTPAQKSAVQKLIETMLER